MKSIKCFLCGATVRVRANSTLVEHSVGMSGLSRYVVRCSASGMHGWTKVDR